MRCDPCRRQAQRGQEHTPRPSVPLCSVAVTVVPEPAQQGPAEAGGGELTLGTDVPSLETEDSVPEGTARLLRKR